MAGLWRVCFQDISCGIPQWKLAVQCVEVAAVNLYT